MFIELGDYFLNLKQITHIYAHTVGDKIRLLVHMSSGEDIQIVLEQDKAVKFLDDLRFARSLCGRKEG